MTEKKVEFGNSLQFILTVVGFAVGLGNIWRFPYLVFDNGGGAFLIIFFIILLIVGIPIFMLELALGQFSGLGPAKVFHKIAPIFQGVGYAAVTVNIFVGFYYNVIIAYCLYYFFLSMASPLPWSSCNNSSSWVSPNCVVRDKSMNCSTFNELYPNPVSPSEEFFYNKILRLSDSISNTGTVSYQVALCLLACWIIVFLALVKGVESLGKISYFTATIPYVILTALVINGALLSGAIDGVYYYIGSVDVKRFSDPIVYKNAAVQAFFSLSACTGGLITMSKFNPFDSNLIRDSFLVPFMDCFTGFYAGFAIFTVLGHMYNLKCVENFKDVVSGGPELAFIVYPEGITLIVVPTLWSILFFLMMLALGFGSEFSIVESIMVLLKDTFEEKLKKRLYDVIMRGVVCLVFFLLGLTMTTEAGFYILNLIDEFINGYPVLIIGILEVIIVSYVYGCDRFINDIELMVGKKPKWFWWICKATWMVLAPLLLIAIVVATAIFNNNDLSLRGNKYPSWAIGIGWVIAIIPLAIIVGCAVAQIYIYRHNWRALFKPDPAYYEHSNRCLAKRENLNENPLNEITSSSKVMPINDNPVFESTSKF